jgi:CubicO group peptidase (beta-lactamase class C family)
MAAHRVPAMSVAVVDGGVVTQIRSFGKLANGRAIPQDAIYNAASLAKPVTALVALKLADKGLFDLDTPLPREVFDADLKNHEFGRMLTPRHILTHRSGLPNWRYLTENGRLTFEFKPGEKVQYSGEGFELLRKAIEFRSRRTIEELARLYVFEPAGMAETSYLFPTGREARIVTRYDSDGKVVSTPPHKAANGAANLMTTAGDYGRFVAYVMNGAGLKKELAHALIDPAYPRHSGINFTLGWSITEKLPGGGKAIAHTGSDAGVSAIAIGLPGQQKGLVILSNSENAMPVWQAVISEQLGGDGDFIIRENRR